MRDECSDLIGKVDMQWTYRVAQNYRPSWALLAAMQLACALWLLNSSFPVTEIADLSLPLAALGFVGFAILTLRVGGLISMRRPATVDRTDKAIPPESLWILHIPFFLVTLGFGVGFFIEYHNISTDSWEIASILFLNILYAGCWFLIGITLYSLAVSGHRRILVFTPASLEYTRGRFRASIPWDDVTALRPVCDANVMSGGMGRVDRPSLRNLRAGVQLFVRDGVDMRGKAMRFRINGQDVIGVDCSSYRIDPNTLINAIYLLVEHPELRPLLNTPEGAQLFAGPTRSLRRTMNVGDTWDRNTNQINPATENPPT